jgi:hypothetical protein
MLHHEEADRVRIRGLARIGGFADVDETADVRMIERGDSARFAIESFSAAGVDGEFLRQHLDRYDPIQTPVVCLIHLAHAAGSNQPENLIGPKVNAGYETHSKSLKLRRIIWSNRVEMEPRVDAKMAKGAGESFRVTVYVTYT